MNYLNKLNKYKYKLNLVGGSKDCDILHANEINSISYIKDFMNLTPFYKNIFKPQKTHPVCSYSISNEARTQVYVPTLPTFRDKLFQHSNYYVRAYPKLFKNYKGIEIKEWDIVIWSSLHKKWYLIEFFPSNDTNILINIAKDLNLLEESTFNNKIDILTIQDQLRRIIPAVFIARKIISLDKEDERYHDPLKEIEVLLENASKVDTTASDEYIEELTQLKKVNSDLDLRKLELEYNPEEIKYETDDDYL